MTAFAHHVPDIPQGGDAVLVIPVVKHLSDLFVDWPHDRGHDYRIKRTKYIDVLALDPAIP